MKNFTLLFILLPLFSFSQNKEKTKISFDITTGGYSNFRKWKENGLTGGYEFSLNRKSIVYSANFIVGFGISKNINNKNGYFQAFLESDVLVGKQFNLNRSIMVQPQVGIGYLHYTNHFQGDKENLIGVPVQFKLIFFNYNDISFGLIPRVNFNTVQNNYSLLFTLNFKG